MGDTMFGDLASTRDGLRDVEYLADDGIASVVFLAEKLGKATQEIKHFLRPRLSIPWPSSLYQTDI